MARLWRPGQADLDPRAWQRSSTGLVFSGANACTMRAAVTVPATRVVRCFVVGGHSRNWRGWPERSSPRHELRSVCVIRPPSATNETLLRDRTAAVRPAWGSPARAWLWARMSSTNGSCLRTLHVSSCSMVDPHSARIGRWCTERRLVSRVGRRGAQLNRRSAHAGMRSTPTRATSSERRSPEPSRMARRVTEPAVGISRTPPTRDLNQRSAGRHLAAALPPPG